ncbi:hypothetical protein [Brevibacillus borstelensis]|uniref:hypothetical protein n=1 Tax=Brevibacillus borstelensis TaxID=45462 RepID=UPI0030C64852
MKGEDYLQLFRNIPHTDSLQNECKAGVTEEQVKQIFGDFPVLTITWKDERGAEHTETIPLRFVEQ